MTLREDTQALLERHGLWAKKRFGQNFLIDGGVLQDIAHAALRGGERHVIEIGPGLGALTGALLDRGVEVRAIEMDRTLVPILEQEHAGRPLTILPGDALAVDFTTVYPPAVRPAVAGNIPYNISSPLLMTLLAQRAHLGPVTLMVQKEVADRWAAGPGSKAYGSPSVMLQVFADIERVRRVPPQCFLPRPKVDSAVVRITWLEAPRVPVPDPAHFERTVRAGFGQRRKTLRNALRAAFDAEAIARAAEALDLGRRAETLDLEEWSTLATALRDA